MQNDDSRQISAIEISVKSELEQQNNSSKISTKWPKDLNHCQLAVIALLALGSFLDTVSFTCIVPFFPMVTKGLSTSKVGLSFGIFRLVIFLISPFVGKNMAKIHANRAFSGGIFLSGLATIGLGLAIFAPSSSLFFIVVLITRTAQAIGHAGFATGSWAIVGRLFPQRISMLTAVNEVAYGIGYMLGPPLGSALYELGGYLLPLLIVGVVQVVVALCSMPLYWGLLKEVDTKKDDDENVGQNPSIFQLLFIPDVLLTMASLFVFCIAYTFYQPALAWHLATVWLQIGKPGGSPTVLVGAMMAMLSIVYMISAPVWGFLLDRYNLSQHWTPIILLGGLLVSASVLLMGPAPFLPLSKNLFLIVTAFVLLGIASAIVYIPVFRWCVDAAKQKGFDEKSPALCGLISGLFQSTVSLGSFLGSILGGLSCQQIGFAWTATVVAGIEAIHLGIHLAYRLINRMKN